MRRHISGLVAAAVAVTGLAAVPAPSDAERPASARTTLRLLEVGIDAPVAERLTAALGDVGSVSGRLDGPARATLGLVGAHALGTDVAAIGWSTADGDQRGDASVPVSEGGVEGLVQLLGYAVEASGGDARSQLNGLSGRLAAGPIALELGSGARGIATSITGDNADAATSLAVSSIDLRLGDLLSDGLLDRLPLGVVLDLLDRLPVTLPDVQVLIDQIEELVNGLREVSVVVEQIIETRKELLALVDDDPAVAAAADAAATAEAVLADAQKELAAAIAARDAAAATLADTEAELAAALAAAAETTEDLQAQLDAALAELAAAEQAVAIAEAELDAAKASLAIEQAELEAALLERAAAQATVDSLEDDLALVEAAIEAIEAEIALLDPVLDLAEILLLEDELEPLYAEKERLEAAIATAAGALATKTAAVNAAQTDVNAAATTVTQKQTALTSAQSDLADDQQDVADAKAALAAGSPAVAAAQKAVSDAQAALASAQSAVDAARASVTTARTTLESALNELDRILFEAAATIGDVATKLTERLTELRGQLDDVLEQVRTVVIALPDLDALLDELRSALADVPVVSLGQLGITLDLAADARSATAGVVCELGSLTVLGEVIADPTCAQAHALIATVPDVLADLLTALPVELPVPSISGLDIRTTATGAPDADGVTRAAASITGLRVHVPSVELSGILDGLTAELEALLGSALAAEGLLGSAPLISPLGITRQVTDPVSSAFAQLQAQLDGLPVGAALDGLRTVGIDVTVASLQSEVLSGAAVLSPLDVDQPLPGLIPGAPGAPIGTPPAGSPGTPAGDPDDPAGAPGGPSTGGPNLPATGGGMVLLPGALMLGGLLLRRRL